MQHTLYVRMEPPLTLSTLAIQRHVVAFGNQDDPEIGNVLHLGHEHRWIG